MSNWDVQIHVIPVPYGYTPDQAYDEIRVFGRLLDYRWWRWRFQWPFRQWAVVEVVEPR